MGVPKFYRWISERYPCLSEPIKDHQIGEFDCLYLDMNGIVHNCTHPDDNLLSRITEESMMRDIFHYIDFLFQLIKPKRHFFMAIDGVAPRAKMNQQRGRRFRACKTLETQIKEARAKGELLPDSPAFDSNCITPGTEFMVRLQNKLIAFTEWKISTDKLWQKVEVHYSGHEVPGEGEHKIMDFIRYQKIQPGYDCNTKHCLYGLDADLIMLGLVTHEHNFTLLREQVQFTRNKKAQNLPEKTEFQLLHLSLLREYLDNEFSPLKETLPFEYDIVHVIDDWVLMCYLAGNDFIPNLPYIHIKADILPSMWDKYMQILPTLGGYLNESGTLHLRRFHLFIRKLAEFDYEHFDEENADLKYFNGKARGAKGGGAKRSKPRQLESFEFDTAMSSKDIRLEGNDNDCLLKATDAMSLLTAQRLQATQHSEHDFDEDADLSWSSSESSTGEDSDEKLKQMEFRHLKDSYYREKFNIGGKVTQKFLTHLSLEYIRALQWILYYYYNGVSSWSWFYPYHYAPYLSDLSQFVSARGSDAAYDAAQSALRFDLSRPFLPFQQLMAVMPSGSRSLLPKSYWPLMLDDDSPIIDFYPIDFTLDLNGKLQEWEAVVQIPFIDQDRLLKAMRSVENNLEPGEVARNVHTEHRLYTYAVMASHRSITHPVMIGCNSTRLHARCELLDNKVFMIDHSLVRKGISEHHNRHEYFLGFPSFSHLHYTAKLFKSGVKVFNQSSRSDNMIISITDSTITENLHELALKYINSSVYCGWPHLYEAKVVGVEDSRDHYYMDSTSAELTYRCIGQEFNWPAKMSHFINHHMNRFAIDVGDVSISLAVKRVVGLKYECTEEGIVALVKQYSDTKESIPIQTCIKASDISFVGITEREQITMDEMFPIGSEVFMTSDQHYAAYGKVTGYFNKRIIIDFEIEITPDFSHARLNMQEHNQKYVDASSIAKRLGITTQMVNRITGSIFVNVSSNDKHIQNRPKPKNIGLNLKFSKRNEMMVGYTRRHNSMWLYSDKVMPLIQHYFYKFPSVVILLRNNKYDDVITEDELNELNDILTYLKTLPHSNQKSIPADENVLDLDTINLIIDSVEFPLKKPSKVISVLVTCNSLHKPCISEKYKTMVNAELAKQKYRIFDRVVCINHGVCVPVGLHGTVIGVPVSNDDTHPENFVYEVLFDTEFNNAISIRGSDNRCYKLSANNMMNLSQKILDDSQSNSNNNNKVNKKVNPIQGILPRKVNNLNQSAHLNESNSLDYIEKRKPTDEEQQLLSSFMTNSKEPHNIASTPSAHSDNRRRPNGSSSISPPLSAPLSAHPSAPPIPLQPPPSLLPAPHLFFNSIPPLDNILPPPPPPHPFYRSVPNDGILPSPNVIPFYPMVSYRPNMMPPNPNSAPPPPPVPITPNSDLFMFRPKFNPCNLPRTGVPPYTPLMQQQQPPLPPPPPSSYNRSRLPTYAQTYSSANNFFKVPIASGNKKVQKVNDLKTELQNLGIMKNDNESAGGNTDVINNFLKELCMKDVPYTSKDSKNKTNSSADSLHVYCKNKNMKNFVVNMKISQGAYICEVKLANGLIFTGERFPEHYDALQSACTIALVELSGLNKLCNKRNSPNLKKNTIKIIKEKELLEETNGKCNNEIIVNKTNEINETVREENNEILEQINYESIRILDNKTKENNESNKIPETKSENIQDKINDKKEDYIKCNKEKKQQTIIKKKRNRIGANFSIQMS